MSGVLIPVLDRTDYDFTNTQAGSSAEIPILQNIDVSQYSEATLLVRVHSASFSNAGSSLTFRVRRVAPTEEDPAQFFREAGTSFSLAVGQSPKPPYLANVTLGPNLGGWISLFLVVTQGSTSTAITATLSAELSLKDG